MTVRVFISVPIPVKDEMDGLFSDLRKTGKIRTPSKAQMHLTLCFIGDVEERKIRDIERCVDNAVADIGPSEITVKGISTFPEKGDPRIVWTGIETDIPLKTIADRISLDLDAAGIYHDKKPFKPHFTVGRVNGRTDLSDILGRYSDTVFLTTPCTEIRVMKSELLPSGAKHSVIHSSELKNDT